MVGHKDGDVPGQMIPGGASCQKANPTQPSQPIKLSSLSSDDVIGLVALNDGGMSGANSFTPSLTGAGDREHAPPPSCGAGHHPDTKRDASAAFADDEEQT